MTPEKQEAIRLYSMFAPYTKGYVGGSNISSKDKAKQCALICLREKEISALNQIPELQQYSMKNHFKKVKQEIDKL